MVEDGAVTDKTLERAKSHGWTSHDEVDNPQLQQTKFYQCQSYQKLGKESDRVRVPIYIDSVHHDWYKHLDNAIGVINQAAPGLYLYKVDKLDDANIQICGTKKRKPSTKGNIQMQWAAKVSLPDGWPNEKKKRTSVHELLHALGFQHEHQRRDGSQAVKVGDKKKDNCQYTLNMNVIGVTRFDPFSIMLYSEKSIDRKTESEPAWELKPPKEKNNEMSELDKVALNLLYRPCKGPHYNPHLSGVTGMWYCGRKVMERHNYPDASITDGYCGPNKSANCHACRVLINDTVKKHIDEGRWQGWSGFFYCGKKVYSADDEYCCGPDTGSPCPECRNILLPCHDFEIDLRAWLYIVTVLFLIFYMVSYLFGHTPLFF